jgi:hypothetical protein
MRSPRPAQAKFIIVAAAWRAVTPGVALAQEAGDLPLRQVGVAVRLARGGEDQLRHEHDDLLAHRRDLGGEGLAVRTGLEVQYRPGVRVARGVLEERAEPFPELPVGGQIGPDTGPHRLDEFLGGAADAGEFGYLVHRRGHVPALSEDLHGGVQHLLFTDRTRHPLGLHGTHTA